MTNSFKNKLSERLMEDIKTELERIGYGSLEIYVQNNKVTQMTVRNIKKTNVDVNDGGSRNYQNYKNKVLTIKKQ